MRRRRSSSACRPRSRRSARRACPRQRRRRSRPLGLRAGHGRHRRARGVDRQPRAAPAGRPRVGGSALSGGGRRQARAAACRHRQSRLDIRRNGRRSARRGARGRKSRRPRGFDRSSSSRFRARWDYPTSRAAASSGSRCRWRRCRRYGVDIVPDELRTTVEADVLVGQDGQPRAIRLVTADEQSTE